MYNTANSPSPLTDPREQLRCNQLQSEIEKGNQFAAGELNFRRTLALNGMNHDQIENAISDFFAAPF